MEKQNRLKSKTLWLSIAALIAFILGNYGLYDVVGLNEESYQELVSLLLAVAIAFGIINNPTEKGAI